MNDQRPSVSAYFRSVWPSSYHFVQKHALSYESCEHKLSDSESAWNLDKHYGTDDGLYFIEPVSVVCAFMLVEALPYRQERCL